MSKDPAFLFYYQDFLVGTTFLDNDKIGCYIKILCHMADKGKLEYGEICVLCGGTTFTKRLQAKFESDSKGFYWNKRYYFFLYEAR